MELKPCEEVAVVAVAEWRSTEVDAEGEDWPLDEGGSSRTRDSMSSWDACRRVWAEEEEKKREEMGGGWWVVVEEQCSI
ncbi:hypothetical protein C1H46_040202 [Malus baccata]|uniref:Uncharacterized protein n=1 Tax=Malus baccata TaxID=106549 RepID=A0A540KJ77_MALBA|nr:hypothetical protein C1H46_040202 [Malus baccata]